MKPKQYCGTINFKNNTYGVLWDPETKMVWVNKPSDPLFGEGNWGDCKARNKSKALEAALVMLNSLGFAP